MSRNRRAAVGAAVLAAALALGTLAAAGAQEETSIGVDALPEDNTATSLRSIESCVRVGQGDTFQVDVFVLNIEDLLGWETYLAYDSAIVQVVDRDVNMFQAADEGSSVFNTSEAVPANADGLFRVGGADLIEPPAGDSGSGVLARLTLKALEKGRSTLSIGPTDLEDDGELDLGPVFRNVDGSLIGDTDGDSFFDGPIFVAEVAVDSRCERVVSTPISGPPTLQTGSDGDGWRWWLTAIVVGAAAAALGVAAYLRRRGHRRASTGAGEG